MGIRATSMRWNAWGVNLRNYFQPMPRLRMLGTTTPYFRISSWRRTLQQSSIKATLFPFQPQSKRQIFTSLSEYQNYCYKTCIGYIRFLPSCFHFSFPVWLLGDNDQKQSMIVPILPIRSHFMLTAVTMRSLGEKLLWQWSNRIIILAQCISRNTRTINGLKLLFW
jgi:hypothetical protein